MEARQKELLKLHSYVEGIDKEITMILQSLQWDRKHLLEGTNMVNCKYDLNHKIPPDKREKHETECFLKSQGYSKDDKLLPAPIDPEAPTVIKLSQDRINEIIKKAAHTDALFKKGPGHEQHVPQSAGRLQAAYSADERRALHDAVVAAAPVSLHIDDFTLPSTSTEGSSRPKTKQEVLAELRNMHRRRVKYRGPSALSRNYSHVLRDLITTQMETYGVPDDLNKTIASKTQAKQNVSREQDYYSKKNYATNEIKTENSSYSKEECVRENPRDKYKEQRNSQSSREVNEHRGKYRHKEDRDRTYYDKNKYRTEKSVIKQENRHSESNDRKRKYKEDKRDTNRRTEQKSYHSHREEHNDRSGRTYKDYDSSSKSGKKRHRDRDDMSSSEIHSDYKYKRYYDI